MTGKTFLGDWTNLNNTVTKPLLGANCFNLSSRDSLVRLTIRTLKKTLSSGRRSLIIKEVEVGHGGSEAGLTHSVCSARKANGWDIPLVGKCVTTYCFYLD